MKQINQLNAQLRIKLSMFEGEMIDYKLSSSNRDSLPSNQVSNQSRNNPDSFAKNNGQSSSNPFSDILNEKETYITKMESQNNDLIMENESLKDKVIKLEIENIK